VSGSSVFRDREFLALAGTAFARSQAYSTILIALALYADLFATTGLVEGLFGTSFALTQLLIVLPLGRAIDRGDARRFLLAGLLINVVVFAGFIFVASATHVILLRLLQGVGATLLWVTGSTVVGQLGPEETRGEWLGAYNQVGAISSLAGDLVGGYLLYTSGFTLTYVVLAAITGLAFVLVLGLLHAHPGGGDDSDSSDLATLRALLDRTTIRALLVFRGAFSMGKMIVLIFLPIYARTTFGLSALAIGGILAGGKLTKALAQGYVGRRTDRAPDRRPYIATGAVVYAVAAAMIPLAATVEGLIDPLVVAAAGRTVRITAPMGVLFLAFGLAGVGDSIRLPASMALFVEEGELFDAAASSMSLRSIVWKTGQLSGPLLAGVLVDAVAPYAAFLLAAGAILVATLAFRQLSATGTQTASANCY
jgi:MFS family permease